MIGAVVLFWWLGRVTGRRREYALGSLWALTALVPTSAFTYRFFSTVSITQNRYYYLSSVGTILILVLVLALLWNSRKTVARFAGAAVICIFIAGSIIRVGLLEKIWSDYTKMYKESIEFIITNVEKKPGYTAAALENPPLAFPYAADAISLYKPGWNVSEVEGGLQKAQRFAPCVYMLFNDDGGRVESVEIHALE